MAEKIKRIAIVWANPYNRNLGVGALAYSSLALISDVLKEAGLKGEITFVGSYLSGKDSINVSRESIEFDNILGMDYLHWKSILKILLRPRKYRVGKFRKFDYVFDIAEGDSFADIYGDQRFFRIYNTKRIFSVLGKKQILLPQTIGPFNNPKRARQAKNIMKKMELVISRDKKSYDYTASFLPKNKISEMIDVAFYMPFDKKVFNNGKINVGINISGLLWHGGYTGKNQFNMKTDYQKLIRRVISFFLEQDNVEIHLVSHVIPEKVSIEDDSVVANLIQKEFPGVVVSPRFKNPIEAKSHISGLDFFTGARMHACIAAFSSGVPVVPMAYSRKFNGLFEDTLDYKWMGDCVNENEEKVLSVVKEGYLNRAELKTNIDNSLNSIVKPRLVELKRLLAQVLTKE